jgi:hypothetical protein
MNKYILMIALLLAGCDLQPSKEAAVPEPVETARFILVPASNNPVVSSGSAYAICYTLKDRKILSADEFLRLADDLRMIRVQIEKYEVPSDKKLTEPLQFSPTQLRPDQKEPPIYVYDKSDPLRAHISRRGISARFSYMWEVFDVKADASRWYERLELSDRMIDLFSPPES